MTTVAITGHRPEQIIDKQWVKESLTQVLMNLQPKLLYQGMAAGVDLLSAEIAHNLHIPYVATKPWVGHEPRTEDKKLYDIVIQQATQVVNVSNEKEYLGPWFYHNRNKYMVDHADVLIAVWNGTKKGGTFACLSYAKKVGVPVIVLNPAQKLITYPENLQKTGNNNKLF